MDDLALTRSLGDLHLEKYVEPTPHYQAEKVQFGESPFFVIGCDGVWDALSDLQAVQAVLASAPDYAKGAAVLRDLSFAHGSTDNISALVVDMSQIVQSI